MMALAKCFLFTVLGILHLSVLRAQLDIPPPTESTAPETLPQGQATPGTQPPPPQQYPQYYNNPNYNNPNYNNPNYNNPNYDFNPNQQQFPYNFPPQFGAGNQIDPINQFQYQPHPNSLFQPYDKNGTNQGQFNNFGRYDNGFGPGNFGYDPYGPYRQQGYPSQIPFPQQPNLNLGPSQRAPDDNTNDPNANPNAEQIPQNQGYQQNPQPYPQQQYIPNQIPNQNPAQYLPFQQQFPTFRPNPANFDYRYPQNAAAPPLINGNLQVLGQGGPQGGRQGGQQQQQLGGPQGGLLPPGGPVVGFYGPPPNQGSFVYPAGQLPRQPQQQHQQQHQQQQQQQPQRPQPTQQQLYDSERREEAAARKRQQDIVIK